MSPLRLTDSNLLQTIKQFTLIRILNDGPPSLLLLVSSDVLLRPIQDPANHSVAVLGTLPAPASPPEDSVLSPAILRIERLPIAEDNIRNIAHVLHDGKLIQSNDIVKHRSFSLLGSELTMLFAFNTIRSTLGYSLGLQNMRQPRMLK